MPVQSGGEGTEHPPYVPCGRALEACLSLLDDSGQEFRVDLTNCDREPIHVPGHVQPFGALLALDPENLTILQASENVQERFGVSAESLLGRPLSSLLTEGQLEKIERARREQRIEGNPLSVFQEEICGRGPYAVSIHSYRDVTILEAEDVLGGEADYHGLIKKTLVRLEEARSLEEFFNVFAAEFRDVNGFDRVLIYKFLEDASGTVVGESLAEGMESFMGLHYPASDIPAQARALFKLNATRLIHDPNYTPSPVVPAINPLTARPLDMSFAALRGVSPIHCQYLRNMGIATSMSQAIIVEGKLWGLVSSHTRVPHLVPYDVRTACEFLARSAALMIRGKEADAHATYVARARELHDCLTASMASHATIIDGLTGCAEGVESYVEAGGCAIVADGEIQLAGQTPRKPQIRRLVEWLKANVADEVFVTNALAKHYPEAGEMLGVAAGALAIRLTRVPGEFVIWFRPEKIQTVEWAGNPEKPVESTPYGDRLHPRKSFEIWRQEVRETSEPWSEFEVDAARRLRIAITEVVLRRAEAVSRANVRLERSNVELDDFAYIASHDLKEPLRGISNYANFLMEDYADSVDEAGRERLGALVRLAERMETLTDSLLHYSRLGRQDLNLEEVDLNDVLQEALDAVGARLEETRTDVRVPWPLPKMRCDRVQLVEVFQNLLSNAAKYNDKPEAWVEVTAERNETGVPGEQSFVLVVRDNGIGIPEKHQAAIFRIFKRLHGRNEYGGGSGAGLTIALKIVERHGGRLWLESKPGVGTAFFFTLGV